MEETAPALWLVVATGAATALLSTIAAYALLSLPLVRVKVRHDLRINEGGARVESYMRVANVRGRPVTLQEAFILRRSGKGRPPMRRPKSWTFPVRLEEGESVRFTFKREEFPKAKGMAIVIDTADRVWPRRRRLQVRGYALLAGGMIGWPWQRDGPTDEQVRRAVERNR